MVAVGALVNSPLTSMIWLKSSKIGGIPDLRGKTIATAGIPYQDAYLKTILGPGRPDDLRRQRRSTSATACCRRSSAAGRRRCSAASATSRGSTCGCAARNRSSPRSTSSACRPTTSSSSSPAPSALEEDAAAGAAVPRRARPRHDRRRRRPAGRDRSPDRGQSRPRPELTAAEVKATLPLLNPPRRKARGGGETPAFGEMNPEEWEAFIGWMRDHGLISGRPEAVRGAQQRLPTGQDSQVGRARPRGSAG